MPFTPFHGGIGLVCKAPFPKHLSFTVFTATQVAIDLESAFNLALSRDPVHRFCHTFLGATLVCLALALLLRRPLQYLRSLFVPMLPTWWPPTSGITQHAALLSAAVGMFGHVIPDAIMHSDSRPFAPFSNENPLLGLVSFETLHLGLMAIGVVGVVGLWWGAVRRQHVGPRPKP